MNINTGLLVSSEAFFKLPEEGKKQYVEVQRPLTTREQHKMKIDPYSPCGCGSGKKFKWCCKK